MGLFDKLLKMGADKLVQEASNHISKALDGKTATAAKSTPVHEKGARPARDGKDWEMKVINGKNVYDKLEACFSVHFSDYEVRKDVSPTEFGGEDSARPFTYVLYLSGEAKAVVMVTRHNQDARKAYRLAQEAARKAGLPFINFFSHFDNREDYILDRLSKYLKATA